MGFGGPQAGYLATKDAYKRNMPGRIIGVSVDRLGNKALRMALQMREQHIKRERATSNICTAQALLGRRWPDSLPCTTAPRVSAALR